MNKLTEAYKAILESVDCEVDHNGHISLVLGGEAKKESVSLQGKPLQLVLPTDPVLKDADWHQVIGFHPTSESVFNGQSEILNYLKSRIEIRLYGMVQQVVATICDFATNKDHHKKAPFTQLALLSEIEVISGAAQTSVIKAIRSTTGTTGKNPLFKLRLVRGGMVGETKYSRTCTIHVRSQKEVGLTGSGRTKQAVQSVYDYVLPSHVLGPVGSDSLSCPYLEVLLGSYVKLAEHLNWIVSKLGKMDGGIKPIPLTWADDIDKLAAWGKEYLPQPLPGNAGPAKSAATPASTPNVSPEVPMNKPVIEQVSTPVSPQQPQPQISAAVPVVVPQQIHRGGGLVTGSVVQQPVHQPQAIAPPPQQQYNPFQVEHRPAVTPELVPLQQPAPQPQQYQPVQPGQYQNPQQVPNQAPPGYYQQPQQQMSYPQQVPNQAPPGYYQQPQYPQQQMAYPQMAPARPATRGDRAAQQQTQMQPQPQYRTY